MKMNDIAARLGKRSGYFADGVLKLYPGAPDEAIAYAESQLNCVLSPQYKEFLRIYNGGRIIEVHINGVQLLGMKRLPKGMSIVDRNFEFRSHEWWPKQWLELGTDGFGNFYVADLSRRNVENEYSILFVDHESLGDDVFRPAFALDYFSFLKKVLDEMIQLYTPEGRLKSKSEDR
jgi:cell wall assembly regulator SMI1